MMVIEMMNVKSRIATLMKRIVHALLGVILIWQKTKYAKKNAIMKHVNGTKIGALAITTIWDPTFEIWIDPMLLLEMGTVI